MRNTRTGHRWAAVTVAAILMMLAAAIAAPAQSFKTVIDFNGAGNGASLAIHVNLVPRHRRKFVWNWYGGRWGIRLRYGIQVEAPLES